MRSDDIVWFPFSCLLRELSLCYNMTRTYFHGYCIQSFILCKQQSNARHWWWSCIVKSMFSSFLCLWCQQ